jgi:hypothetical protein
MKITVIFRKPLRLLHKAVESVTMPASSEIPMARQMPRGLLTVIVIAVALFALLFCGGLPIYFFVCKM